MKFWQPMHELTIRQSLMGEVLAIARSIHASVTACLDEYWSARGSMQCVIPAVVI